MQWIAKLVFTADAELISAATLLFTNLRYFLPACCTVSWSDFSMIRCQLGPNLRDLIRTPVQDSDVQHDVAASAP